MKRIIVCLIALFLLMGISSLPSKVYGNYSGTINIKSDGSVTPSDAPILTSDNVTYVFTENMSNSTVMIWRENIVLDGANFRIEGNHSTDPLSAMLVSASNVTVKNLQFVNFTIAIRVVNSTDCKLVMNQVDNCTYGIELDSSNHTLVSQNNFASNYPSDLTSTPIAVYIGSSDYNNVTENNLVNLAVGVSMNQANHNNIMRNTFSGITTTGNFLEGFAFSNNTFIGNNITNVGTGFNLQQFSTKELTTNNTISQNTITNSSFAVVLGNASGNLFFHNNFLNSTRGVNIFYPNSTINIWDNGFEGNYWSDYNGTDSDQDGIGDTPYSIHQYNIVYQNNTDHYPLMGHFESFNVSIWSHPDDGFEEVDVISNFTISDLGLYVWLTTPNQYLQAGQLFLRIVPVNGQNMTAGFCRMTLPNNILNTSDYIVLTNMTHISVNKLAISNNTHTTLYFTFNISANEEIIIVPEFPSFLILPLFFMATLLTIIFCRKKLTRTA